MKKSLYIILIFILAACTTETLNESQLELALEFAEDNRRELESVLLHYRNDPEKLKAANTVRDMRSKVAKEKEIPESLLTGNTEEECLSQAKALLDFAKGSHSAPSVPDGGEPNNPPSGKTRDQFADWIEQALN